MKPLVIAGIGFLALLTPACRKDFIVENIDNKTLTVNAPANNLITPSNSITFWWEVLEGAEKYNIQVVTPAFATVSKLIADTNIAGNKFTTSLQPGTYQWRIRAFNAGHTTVYQVFNLKVDSSSLLTGQQVIPISPLSGFLTKEKTIECKWNALPSATSYSVEIKLNNTTINTTITTNTSYQYTFPLSSAANHTCEWRVKAINANSVSQYNTAQTFTIDNLPPSVSTPSLPTNNTIVTDTVELVWKRPQGNDVKRDSIFIYTDAAFQNLLKKTTTTATRLRINQIDPLAPLTPGSGSLSPVQYYWRLKSVDTVGNTSVFSNALGFLLYQ